jgi:PAS domain S-box-containing protein
MIDLFKMFVKAFILPLLVCSYSLTIYAAQTNSLQNNQYLSAQERTWIRDHALIKVHNENNWAPFNYNTNGKAVGFSIEYMNLVAERAGFQIEYINGPSWSDFLGMMQTGHLDVMLNIVQTNERQKYLHFTSPYSIVSPVLAIRDEDKDIFSIESIDNKTLCLPKGSSTHEYLSVNHPQLKLLPLEDGLACLQALQSHKVDVVLDGDAILNSLFSKNNFKELRISKIAADPAMASVLRIATRKEVPILRDIIEKTMAQLDDNEVSNLRKKWLEAKESIETKKEPANTGLFTKDELSWIRDNPEIIIGNEMDWPPFDFVENGLPAGLAIDVMKLIAKKSGLKLSFVNGYSFAELLNKLKNKEIDLMPALLVNSERKNFILFTEPYFINRTVIVTREGDKNTETLDDLSGRKVAIVSGYSYESFVRTSFPQLEIVSVPTFVEGLESVGDKSVDAFIGSRTVVYYTINKNLIYGLQIAGPSGIDDAAYTSLSIGVRNDYQILHSIIEKSLATISNEEFKQLTGRWLSIQGETTAGSSTIPTNEYLTKISIAAAVIVFLIIIMVYLSKKMAVSNKVGIQTGTRQFRILLLLSMGIFLGSIAILGWLEMGKIKTKIVKDLESNLNTILTNTDERLNNWVTQEQFSLEQIASNPALLIETEKLLEVEKSNAVLVASQELKNVREILKQSSKLLGLGYFIINRAGTSIASSRDSNIGSTNLIAIQRTGLLEEVFKGKSIFIPSVNSDIADVSHNSSLFFAVPIKNKANDVVAVLTKRLNPANKFSQVLHYSRVGESGETYAFDKNGTLLSESRFEDDLRNIGLINNEQSSLMNIQIRDPGINLLQTKQPIQSEKLPLTLMAESAIKMSHLTASRVANTERIVESNLQGYRDYRGVPVVGAWLWSTQLDMGITSEMDLEEALSVYNTMKFAAISVFSITLLFIIGGTFFILIMGEKTNRIASRAKKELEDQVEERTKNLKMAEEKSRAIVDNAQDAIIVINDESIVMSWNKAAESIFGYLSTDIIGQSVTTIIPPSYHSDHAQGIARFIKTKKNKLINKGPVELTAINSKGETLPVEMALSTYEIDSANFFSANIRDITARLEAEKETQFAKEQAEQANRAKSAFLANMSHELRTPMNAIIGYSEMLIEDAEDDDNEEIIPDLNKINSAGRHLLALINDILDLSKIEAGKMELFLEDIHLQDLLREVIDTSKPLIDKNKNIIKFSSDQTIDLIHGDAMKIKQALFNLISNAAKFTEDGEISIRVSQEAINDTNCIHIAITDSGIGIPENKLDTVFEEFSQADESTTKDYGGTGLGLPLSLKFCKMMGGDITISSELGVGSTFTLIFPSTVINESEIVDKDLPIENDINQSQKNNIVLVIDDDENSRDILKRYLEKENYSVLLANNSRSGIEIAKNQKPDVITLDIMMPDNDGWSTLQLLKDNPITQNIPVIMVSIASDKETAITLGAVDALMKPIDKVLLIDAVSRNIDTSLKQNILIVDDDEVNRGLIRRYLRDSKLNIYDAVNGADALSKLSSIIPDLILLDLMMPVMNGFEFLENIRQNDDYKQVPIIVITSKSLSSDEFNFLNSNTLGVLQKGDLTKSDLNQQLKNILRNNP